ncbi:MAG: NAD-dependent epimerase/dehydratase family protein [Chlorobiales bacterium]|nr:NAD-dependent epimerase/dehydratase family protein [Chlorobiales bacterium]
MPETTILVTGATGYIGSALVQALHQQFGSGVHIKALVRKTSSREVLGGTPVEFVEGDLHDPVSLWRATEGVDVVFHVAALVSYQQIDFRKLYKANVIGTRELIDACLKNGVKLLIYTSSIAAVGVLHDGAINPESAAFQDWQHRFGYMKSKYLAEMEVLRGVAEGLDAVIVNPGVVIGQYPGSLFKKGAAAKLLIDIYEGNIPYYPAGGVGFVDIEDTVAAHIAAWKHGQTGSRYNVVSENLSYKELFERIGAFPYSHSRTAQPLNRWMGRMIGGTSEIISVVIGSTTTVTLDGVRLAERKLYFDNEKSKQELGLSYRPFDETIERLLKAHSRLL